MTNNFKTKEEQLFCKQAHYSIHPTLEETGIGKGGFKKPSNIILNVDIGDFAKINEDDEINGGLVVKIIKYAGERPWWKGYLYIEGEGPCWTVQSLGKPFKAPYFDSFLEVEKMPVPDHMLFRLDNYKKLGED